MQMKKLFILLLWSSLLIGCGFQHTTKIDAALQVATDTIPLPTVESLGSRFTATQELIGDYQGKQNQLLFQLESDTSRLVMVGVTSIGHRLITLEYQQGNLSAELSPLLPSQVKADYLLRDFLLTFSNVEAINLAFKDSPYRLAINNQGETFKRVIYNKLVPIIEIEYDHADPWQARVQFKHLVRPYSLQIKTVAKQPL